jgi:hypothetical protein
MQRAAPAHRQRMAPRRRQGVVRLCIKQSMCKIILLVSLLALFPPLVQESIRGIAQTKPVSDTAFLAQYEWHQRSEDWYLVRKQQKMGVVDKKGRPVAPLAYDTILPFREGMAIAGTLDRGPFKITGWYGFIDKVLSGGGSTRFYSGCKQNQKSATQRSEQL